MYAFSKRKQAIVLETCEIANVYVILHLHL